MFLKDLLEPCGKNRHILIAGYFGSGNAGDELILQALVGLIREHASPASITVTSGERSPGRDGSVRNIYKFNYAALTRAVMTTDVIVFGGGVLQDSSSSLSLYYYLSIITAGRLLGKKIIFAACGFGPVRRPLNRFLTGLALGGGMSICLRDPWSAEELKKTAPSCRPGMFYDIVFFSPVPPRGRPPFQGRIGFSLRKLEGGDLEGCLDALSALRAGGWDITLLVMDRREDRPAAASIAEKLPGLEIREVPFSVPAAYEPFSGLDAVVSMRYHAIVLAALLGIPSIGVSRGEKIASVSSQLGQIYIKGNEFGALLENTGKLKKNYALYSSELNRRVSGIRASGGL